MLPKSDLLRTFFLIGLVVLTGCGGKQAPDVWSVAPVCGQPNRVWVQFATGSDRDPLNQTSAETISNYSVGGVSVTKATLYSADQSVLLTLSGNLTQASEINVTAANVKDTANRIQSPSSVTLPVVYHATQQGAMGLYFRNKNLAGSLERTSVDANIDFDVGSGSLGTSGPDNFSVRWYTFLEVFQAGDYGLRITSDDGARVWFQDIGDDPVIDAWMDGSATYTAADTFTATASDIGKRKPVVVEYYEDKVNAKAKLQWDTPSSGFVTVPSNRMYTCLVGPASIVLASYSITAPATASTCGSASVSITAKDSSGVTLTSYTGSVNLTTTSNHGDWAIGSGGGTLSNGTADDGAATYTFAAADNGTVTLNLTNVHADTLRINANETGGSVNNQSSALAFTDNAFVVSFNDTFANDVIAGRNHNVVVQFIRRPPGGAQCAVDSGYSGSKNLKLWRTNTTANDASAAAPTLQSGNLSVVVPTTMPATNNASGVVFTAGQAEFILVTTDVGQYALNVRDDTSGYVVDASGAAIAVNGTSANWTVRPFGLLLSAQNSDGNPNPAASDASGGAFAKAGSPFNLTVTAVRYESADDDNPTDGVPDGHNDNDASNNDSLANNGHVASFGREGGNATKATVALAATLISPSNGTALPLAGITSVSSFSGGIGTVQPQYDEVGVIEIKATTTNYLGSGRSLYGASGHIGRFTPASFAIDEPSDTTLWHGHGSCSFTYQGETVAYNQAPKLTITAKNAAGNTTKNYGNTYWKLNLLNPSDLSATMTNKPANSTFIFERKTTNASYSWNATTVELDGVATATLSGDTYAFDKHGTQTPMAGDIPFDPKLNLTVPVASLTDTDNICYQVNGACSSYVIDGADNTGFTGTNLRYARLRLTPGSGTNVTPALVPAVVEQWAAVGVNQAFVAASAENNGCTGSTLTTANLTLDNYQGELTAGEVTPQFSGIAAGGTGVISLAVDANANPASVSGLVRVTANVPASLQYRWSSSGLGNPSAVATFGIYGGRAPIFNIQEGFR